MADSRRLVVKYYLFEATRSVGFISPIFTVFLLRDLSFTEVGALSALYSALVVLGELPTGYVADRVGRRATLALSVGFVVASLSGFVLAQSFPAYVVFYVLWALARTFASGSVDAWLYDLLAEALDTESFTRIRGRGASVMQWVSVVTMVVGGALYAIAPTLPFVAAAVLNAFGLGVLLTLPEAESETRRDEAAVRRVVPTLRREFSVPSLRWLLLYGCAFFAVVGAAGTYIQPLAEAAFRPWLAATTVGGRPLPLGVALGLLYAGFTAVSAVGSYYAGPIRQRIGLRRVLFGLPIVVALTLFLPQFALVAALPMFVAMRGATAVLTPMLNQYVNDRVGSELRATALSGVSMLSQSFRVPLALGMGVVADGADEAAAVAVAGGLFLVVAGGVAVAELRRSPSKEARSARRVEDDRSNF